MQSECFLLNAKRKLYPQIERTDMKNPRLSDLQRKPQASFVNLNQSIKADL